MGAMRSSEGMGHVGRPQGQPGGWDQPPGDVREFANGRLARSADLFRFNHSPQSRESPTAARHARLMYDGGDTHGESPN